MAAAPDDDDPTNEQQKANVRMVVHILLLFAFDLVNERNDKLKKDVWRNIDIAKKTSCERQMRLSGIDEKDLLSDEKIYFITTKKKEEEEEEENEEAIFFSSC